MPVIAVQTTFYGPCPENMAGAGLINYTPVDLDWILGHDIVTILRMENSNSEPVRLG